MSGPAADLAMLATAARHSAASMLLPVYARDAIAAAARLVAGQAQELAELRREVAELREVVGPISQVAGEVARGLAGDKGGAVLVDMADNPRRVTFTRVQPGAVPGMEG